MHFFFGLSSTDLLWQVDGEHDIQTIRILSYLTLALGVYVCVCYSLDIGGRPASLCNRACLAKCFCYVIWNFVVSVRLDLRVSKLLWRTRQQLCCHGCFCCCLGKSFFFRITKASRSPRRSLGLARRFSSHHYLYKRYFAFLTVVVFHFSVAWLFGKLPNFFGTLLTFPENAKTLGFRYFFLVRYQGFSVLVHYQVFPVNYQALLVNCAWPSAKLRCTLSICSHKPHCYLYLVDPSHSHWNDCQHPLEDRDAAPCGAFDHRMQSGPRSMERRPMLPAEFRNDSALNRVWLVKCPPWQTLLHVLASASSAMWRMREDMLWQMS